MNAIHIADTGQFAAMGHPLNRRYRLVRAFARQNDVTFVLPERVYDELTVTDLDVDNPPIDTAVEEGRAHISAPVEYTTPLVSRTMDGVQRYIANADDRPADQVERADSALAGVSAQAFAEGSADRAYIYTTDIAAGEGAAAIFASEGYGDSVTDVNGVRFVEDRLE